MELFSLVSLLLFHHPLAASFALYPERRFASYGRLLFVRNAVTRPGPLIDDWSKNRVPFLNVEPGKLPLPYGLNVEVTPKANGFESTPRQGVVTSLIWAFSGNTTYMHPELRPDFPVGEWLRKRPSLGIALSGGGMRAASTCLGWLRGLNELGLLSKARYISSNSGATWVTMPLAAKQLLDKKEKEKDLNYTEFLGHYVEPEDITGQAFELGRIGRILKNSDILTEKNGKRRSFYKSDKKIADFTSWVTAIDENFVQPMQIPPQPDFLLDMGNAYLWNDVKRLDDKTFPFPIFVGTAYPDRTTVDIAVPFEFTPLYIGLPIDPRIYGKESMNCSGGYTQSIAFNTDVTDRNIPGCGCAPSNATTGPLQLFQLPLPVKVFKATEMTGISSSFFAAAEVQTGWNLNKVLRWIPFIPEFLKQFPNPESYKYWSPESGGKSCQLQFADGGLYDNTGVLGLLRRRCSTIIACVSSDSAVTVKDPETRFADIASLFGCAKNPLQEGIPSVNAMQVFESSKWNDLLANLKQNYTNGKPQVCRMELKVQPNQDAGIYHSDTVEVYFCVNGRSTEWEKKLGPNAQELKAKLDPGWCRPFVGPEPLLSLVFDLFSPSKLTNHFPYFSTFRVIYDQDVVNMMAHNCAYGIKTGLEELGFKVPEQGFSPAD